MVYSRLRPLPVFSTSIGWQGFSAGIGNWVADEVLYQAALHPEQPANSLNEHQTSQLHHHLKSVPVTAIDADANSDNFPKDWLFHHK